jgi:hypothetical protein
MNEIPPKFNFRDTSRWRPVDLETTKRIAHLCTTGVNYQDCSKSDIIEGVAKPHGYTSDATKFMAMMDAASKFLPRMKAEFYTEVGRRLGQINQEFK